LLIYILLDRVGDKLMKNQIEKSRKSATPAFIRTDSKKGINRAKLARLAGKGSLQRTERGI